MMIPRSRENRTATRSMRGLAAMLIVTTVFSGCSRTFWRKQADRDAYNLVAEKLNDPAWAVPRIDITPDPRSRFFDPYDADRGPLPPDDAAAGEYMLCVAGKRGYKSWHKFGQAFSIENPHWLESYGITEQLIQQASHNGEPSSVDNLPGLEDLTMQQAVELSNIHSRDYQTAIEDVYLRALELSFERFQFDVRYLGIGSRLPSADLLQTSIPSTSDDLSLGSRAGISQLLPSGGQWIVELANQTVWLFSGPNTMNTASTISYSLVQPLLMQAGRKIALENLTQSERQLLYSVRLLARFRKEFFTDVVGGQNGYLSILQQIKVVSNEQDNIRRNREQLQILRVLASQQNRTFFEPLEVLPANLVGGFAPAFRGRISYDPVQKRLIWRGEMSEVQRAALLALNPQNLPWQTAVARLVQLRLFEPLDALPQGVTIPQELSAQPTIDTGQLSYNAQEKRLYWRGPMSEAQKKLLRSLHPGDAWQTASSGFINRLRAEILTRDILQLENRLLGDGNRLRGAVRTYKDLQDRFRLLLGLPPNFNLGLDATLLNDFQLIDPRLSGMETRLKKFVDEWAKLDATDPDLGPLRGVISQLKELSDEIPKSVLNVIDSDLADLRTRIRARTPPFDSKSELGRARVLEDLDRDEVLLRGTRLDYVRLSNEVERLHAEFASTQIQSDQAFRAGVEAAVGAAMGRNALLQRKRIAVEKIAVLREALRQITQNAQVIQIGLRVELISLQPVYRDPETGKAAALPMHEAVRKALASRLDLKNARAQVMDARRQVEIAANRLEAILNLRVVGDISTRDGNNKPLDFRGRQSEFRVGVGFTAPLDQVNARNAYRDAQIAYQRARRAYMALEDQIKLQVRTTWRRLDVLKQNFETARELVRISASQFDIEVEAAAEPGQSPNRNSGLNLLTALANVLNAQNALIQIWVDYEQSRLNIHRDMGIMEIDERGVWTDDYYQRHFPAKDLVPPQPAPMEGRLPHATPTRLASKPRLLGLQRVGGSLRIRGDAGSVAERKRIARNHGGSIKRSSVEPWSSGRAEARVGKDRAQADHGDLPGGNLRRGSARVSDGSR